MRRLFAGEGGFTLAEVMVTILTMLVVMFALYSIFDMSVRVFALGNDRVEAVEGARLGLERMEREVRAAYPRDPTASPPDTRLLTTMTPTRIAFGNDGGVGDRKVDMAREGISYSLSTTGPPYTLRRTVGGGTPQVVVENVGAFDDGTPGLRFEYLKASEGGLVTARSEAEVEVVRITLRTDTEGRAQQVSTAVALRNRG